MLSSILSVIWGLKTQAIFDVWSIEHVLSGISIGWFVRVRNDHEMEKILGKKNNVISKWFDVTGVLWIAFMWEAVEHYLETGLLGFKVEYWFQGVEFWGNRLLADPLLLLFGYWIAKRYPKYVLPARILSAIWLLVHIFLFPDSMYLQRVLFGAA
jgi:hypothetical protein